nr:hemagglutinin repeat-containing protein [Achromobacter pulmonis]
MGASKSRSTTDRNASTAFGSTAAAGHNLTIIATGAGRDSDINLTGSNLSAGNSALLKAEDGILLQAARNTTEQKTVSKSSNASIGIGYTTGGQQNGFMLELGASLGRGKAQGEDESWTHSRVTAGNVLAIQSGGGTTLKGATGQARQVIASVGGDLLLESLQDSSQYASSNKSAGFGVSLCIPPYCAGSSSVSANASTGKLNSNFWSITEQTGLRAGDGGFQIDVQNNTKLIGSVIASSDRAIAGGLNHLGTGTLVTEDIGNRAKYSGSQSIGGGFGFGGGKGADTGLGTSKDGDVAGGAGKQHGSSIATDGNGFGMGTPVVVAARGSGGSTTQSAISAGAIVIRDEAAQQDLTGMTAVQTVAALNRDTSSDTLNALQPIFDKEKIEAGFEIASEAQKQVGQFLETRAREAKALEEALKGAPAGPRKDQLRSQYEAAQRWGPGGRYREALMAVSLATGANVTGSASGFVQAATVNYLQSLSATKIKEIAPLLGGEGSAGHGAACLAGMRGGCGKKHWMRRRRHRRFCGNRHQPAHGAGVRQAIKQARPRGARGAHQPGDQRAWRADGGVGPECCGGGERRSAAGVGEQPTWIAVVGNRCRLGRRRAWGLGAARLQWRGKRECKHCAASDSSVELAIQEGQRTGRGQWATGDTGCAAGWRYAVAWLCGRWAACAGYAGI